MKLIRLIALPLFLLLLIGCQKDDAITTDDQRTFGIFTVLEDNATIEMNGDITSRLENDFDRMLAAFPNAKKVIMKDCPGSLDDETNLKVSKKMHERGFEFHLMATSVIASGAVDMYVGGVKRTREAGSKIGVHSWGSEPGEPIATSYPRGHAVHLPYINYYKSVGFSQQEAEAFYYFTIEAAPANDIHWMTDQEINTYKILKP